MAKPRIQLHLPNLYVGGIERWALTLLNGLPEFDWVISTPTNALSHRAGLDEFSRFTLVEEAQTAIPVDLLVTTWGISPGAVTPTVAVAHSAFEKYRAMMGAVRHDFAVAVSKEARSCFPDAGRVEVIYNGVDLERLKVGEPRAAVRERLGLATDALVVGYVGRWGFQKNPLAAALAASSHPGAVALYVGPTPDDPALVDQAQRLAPCRFVPPEQAENIGDLYAAMDVCVFASRSEGFGLAIAEAWYAGVPVAATEVGIVAEHPDLVALLPQEPGLHDLRVALDQALQPPQGRLSQARTLVADRYSDAVMVGQWRDYIRARLAAPKPAGRS